MRVPSAQFSLPALRVGASAPIDVVLQRFQAHVLKHPLGLGAVLGLDSSALRAPGPRRWNHEGWDAVGDPPVVDLPTRRAAMASVRQLSSSQGSCAIPRVEHESFAGEPYRGRMHCYDCGDHLAGACHAIPEMATIGRRYVEETDRTLALVAGAAGQPIAIADFVQLLHRQALRPVELMAVASVSRPRNSERSIRVSRSDGLRVELTERAGRVTWRTSFRSVLAKPSQQIRHLTDLCITSEHQHVVLTAAWWSRMTGTER